MHPVIARQFLFGRNIGRVVTAKASRPTRPGSVARASWLSFWRAFGSH
jgi:hypothetical protein